MALALVAPVATAGSGGANLQKFAYALTFYGDDVSAEIAVARQLEIQIDIPNAFTSTSMKDAILAAVQVEAAKLGLTVPANAVLIVPLARLVYWNDTGLSFVQSLKPAVWFRYGIGITAAAGAVSQWADQSGNARHLVQATGTNQPALQADLSILFDGVDNFMKCVAFTLNQPETIYILFKQIAWVINEAVCDGNTSNSGVVYMETTTPRLSIFSTGGSNPSPGASLALATYGVIAGFIDDADTLIQLNNEVPLTASSGTPTNMSGFTLGARGDNVQWSNVQVKEAIVFSGAHDAATRSGVIAYLAEVGGLTI